MSNEALKALDRITKDLDLTFNDVLGDVETIRKQLKLAEAAEALVKSLTEYYVPQLKFSQDSHRKFAVEHASHPEISSSNHGCANGIERSIGCIEEALQQYKDSCSE